MDDEGASFITKENIENNEVSIEITSKEKSYTKEKCEGVS